MSLIIELSRDESKLALVTKDNIEIIGNKQLRNLSCRSAIILPIILYRIILPKVFLFNLEN